MTSSRVTAARWTAAISSYGGRYVDRLEKRDGVWRIAKRKVLMDWNRSEPSRDMWHEGMYTALSSHGRRDRQDVRYQASDSSLNP
jgi:uncharacterized protein (DUF1330 family)